MKFASRQDAGRRLGATSEGTGCGCDLVLGLPRGGVVVAAEVARLLRCPLDVLVVRKIGHPMHCEFAVGALAEPDVVIFDEGLCLEFPRRVPNWTRWWRKKSSVCGSIVSGSTVPTRRASGQNCVACG